jgi:hypothetical protein
MKISKLTVRILVVLLAIPLILITANSAFAGGNPPIGEEKIKGPIVTGIIIFYPSELGNPDSDVQYVFTGSCRGKDVIVSDISDEAFFSDVDEETLTDLVWNIGELPEGCAPDQARDLIIRKIKNFIDMSPDEFIKQAEVQMVFIVSTSK